MEIEMSKFRIFEYTVGARIPNIQIPSPFENRMLELKWPTIRNPNSIWNPNVIDHPNSERVRISTPHCIGSTFSKRRYTIFINSQFSIRSHIGLRLGSQMSRLRQVMGQMMVCLSNIPFCGLFCIFTYLLPIGYCYRISSFQFRSDKLWWGKKD